MPTARRLAMLGLDAAELDFIRAHPSRLPTLHDLLARGTLRRLGSPAGLLPGAVWPTFATGRSPGEHGVYHHLQWDPAAMRLRRVSAEWLPFEPFWHSLARRGRRLIVADVPMSFPPPDGAGIEVVNWGAHDQLGPLACAPRGLAREIRRRFGRHPMGYEIPVQKSEHELAGIRARLMRGAERKGELVRWLLAGREWDLLLAVFGETHRGGHLLWPDEGVPAGALLDVYASVDRALARVLAALPPDTTILVFALHGMGPNTSQEHFIPAVVDRINGTFAGEGGPPAAGRSAIVRRLREALPAGLQNLVAHAVPVWVRDLVVARAIAGGHRWAETPGFDVLSDLNGYLRLNLRGRERDGALVPDGETRARYVAWMRSCLASLRVADTGEPLVGDVVSAQEMFSGARAHHLPDLVVTWAGAAPAPRLRSDALGEISADLATGRAGNHRPEGFALLVEDGRHGLAPPDDVTALARFASAALDGPG